MRSLNLGGPIGTSIEAKVDWLIQSMRKIESAANETDAARVADGFTISNEPTDGDRTIDADTGTLADLAAAEAAIDKTRDVLVTFLSDLKRRGAKQQA